MQTKVLKIDPNNPEPSLIKEATQVLKNGGLVSFATETVYGLAALALKSEASSKIFESKRRSWNKPLAIAVTGAEEVKSLSREAPLLALRLMERFWPGPLTIILFRNTVVPDIITAGTERVAFRCPNNKVARAILEEVKAPLALTSANLSGNPSPVTVEQVLADLEGKVDLVLDSGLTDIGVESTVLDLTSTPPSVLREGTILKSELDQYLRESGLA